MLHQDAFAAQPSAGTAYQTSAPFFGRPAPHFLTGVYTPRTTTDPLNFPLRAGQLPRRVPRGYLGQRVPERGQGSGVDGGRARGHRQARGVTIDEAGGTRADERSAARFRRPDPHRGVRQRAATPSHPCRPVEAVLQ